MTSGAPAWRLCVFLFLALSFAGSFTGCSQLKRSGIDDEKDPHFMEGKRRLGGMDWDGAIESFERALQSNPNNAAAHRELGILYSERKNDHAAAIYHYQRHLKLQPDSPMGQIITQHINFSKRELAKTDSFSVDRNVQAELEKLSMANETLRKRNEFLEAQLARGPQYITNYVTNYVKLPEFERGGSRSLTQPAQIVERPAEQEAPPEAEAPAARSAQRAAPPTRREADEVAERRTSPARTRPAPSTRTTARTRTVHTVRPGETMKVLARNYGVSLAELRAANPGTARGVRAGQKINIPAK